MPPQNHSFSFTNGITVDFNIQNEWYRGLSGARLDDRPILIAGRGSAPFCKTPDGISYFDFRLLEIRAEGEGCVLDLEAIGRRAPVKDDLDMFNFPQISAGNGDVRDRLRIYFASKEVVVAGEAYRGFSVQYEWESQERQIHWIFESVALAPDGSVEGARLIAQNMTANVCRLEEVLQKETRYSTEENYGPTCIQSPCRGGGSQIFDLVQTDSLAVVTFFESPNDEANALKANCQKAPGEDFVTVSDIHYGPMSGRFRTAPRLVMAAVRTEASRNDAVNRWTRWFNFTSELWCSKLGINKSHSVPTLTLEGTGAGGLDPGMAYPEMLEVWTERLDWVVAQGFKAINLHTPEWVSAANRKTVIFGGNNCCPWEYKLSDQLGGEPGLKAFCDACHAHGIKVFVWIAGHLHTEAPIWKKHPEWIIRTPDTRLWDGHYRVIHSFSFVHGAREWLLEDLKHLREVTGVDGVWFDSFTNLSLGAINWQSPLREPNAPAVLEFLGDLSKLGFELMIECMSQLGVSSWGNLKPEQLAGQEDLLLNSNLRYYVRRQWMQDTLVTRDFYFRSLAAGGPIGVWTDEFFGRPEPFPLGIPEWFVPLTNGFNAVSSGMHMRQLQCAGALWLNAEGKPSCFFAFTDGTIDLDAGSTAPTMVDYTSGAAQEAHFPQVKAGHIYRLESR